MMNYSISWTAPIIPNKSLAGIPLGLEKDAFDQKIQEYISLDNKKHYKFDQSPELELSIIELGNQDFDYLFKISDLDLINWKIFFNNKDSVGIDSRALCVAVREGKVSFIKVWQFYLHKEGDEIYHSYSGKLPGNIGLGSHVKDLLQFTTLDFNSSEEWFVLGEKYEGVEVTGLGIDLDLEEDLDQLISAICVNSTANFIGQ